jgi:hypothetical protein
VALGCRGTAKGQLILESLDDIPLYSVEEASAALQRCALRYNVLFSVALGRGYQRRAGHELQRTMKGAESMEHARCRICRVVSGGVAWQVVAVYESSRKVEAMPARRILDKLLGAPPATVLTQAHVLEWLQYQI